MTAEEKLAQRKDASWAYEEAEENLAHLVTKATRLGSQMNRVGSMLTTLELHPEHPAQSEAALLVLPPTSLDGVDVVGIKELANAIAAARRRLAETLEAKRVLGCR